MSSSKYTVVLLYCFFVLVQNANADTCEKIQAEFDHRSNSLFKKYEQINPDFILHEENKPTLSCGEKNEAVYLLHGFIGTPEEMSDVAEALKIKGYTVLNDIIPGHGSDATIANRFTEVYWQAYVTKNISLLRSVYKKIHFIGFSTGALLIHNYLFEKRNEFSPTSTILYSPFYKPGKPFLDFLNTSLNDLIESVSIKKLYAITKFREIEVAVLKPQNYQEELPLITAEQVVNLGEKVSKKMDVNFKTKIQGKALVFLSATDGLISFDHSKNYAEKSFNEYELRIFKSNRVPHHLMVEEVSAAAANVIDSTVGFIEKTDR